jgi:hypothetical protein
MVQGSIDLVRLGGPEKLDGEKQKKAKELLEKVLSELKDMLASKPGNIAALRDMINMLKELDPVAAAKAEDLLKKMESELSSKGQINMSEEEKLEKMLEIVIAAQAGQLGVFASNNDNQRQLGTQQDQQKNSLGSISVSI